MSQTGMGLGENENELMGMGRKWELNLRHNGNGIGNGNELMGMGGNGNAASHSRTSLPWSRFVIIVSSPACIGNRNHFRTHLDQILIGINVKNKVYKRRL